MNKTFNLKDLGDEVVINFGLSRAQAHEITRFVFDQVKAALGQGKQVRIHKFGTFEVRRRAAGRACDPITKRVVDVPARNVVHLTSSPVLKDAVSGVAPDAS